MSKMNIADAAEYFGVSKEAIHNRVRRGSLKSIVENGVKLVIIDSNATVVTSSNKIQPRKVNNSDDRYYKLLEEQNTKLQEKVENLKVRQELLGNKKRTC